MKTGQLITEMKGIIQEADRFLNQTIYPLSEEQLTWKLSKNHWSIMDILAHLNAFSEYYLPTFEQKLSKTKYTAPSEDFISTPLGKATWKAMKLGKFKNVKRKLKSPKNYNPVLFPHLIKTNTVEIFQEYQTNTLSLLDRLDSVNLKRVKIPLMISKIIRLRFGDALMYLIYHHERHVEQMKQLVNHPSFPLK